VLILRSRNLEKSPYSRVRKTLDKRGLSSLIAYQDYNGNILFRLQSDPSINLWGNEPKTLIIDPKGRVPAVANKRKD